VVHANALQADRALPVLVKGMGSRVK